MAKVHTESNVVSCTKYLILTIIVSFFIKSRKNEKKYTSEQKSNFWISVKQFSVFCKEFRQILAWKFKLTVEKNCDFYGQKSNGTLDQCAIIFPFFQKIQGKLSIHDFLPPFFSPIDFIIFLTDLCDWYLQKNWVVFYCTLLNFLLVMVVVLPNFWLHAWHVTRV